MVTVNNNLLASANSLIDALGGQADIIEQQRCVPAAIARELADAGFFRMLAPASNGGEQTEPTEFVRVVETLATGNAATAWCAMTGATTGLATGWLSKAGADILWKEPNIALAGIYAPLGRAIETDSSFQVTGRWPFASGCENANWVMGGVSVAANNQATVNTVFFPAADMRIIDTWDVLGLSGTGSHDIEVSGIHIPKALSCNLGDKPRHNDRLYRFPVFGLLAHGVAAVATGIARNSLNRTIAALASGEKRGANDSATQQEIAECEAALQSARSWVQHTLKSAWEQAEHTDALPPATRAHLRLSANHATDAAANVVTRCYRLGGGAALYRYNPLQRDLRDIQTLMQHIMVNPVIYRQAGKAILGKYLTPQEL